MDRVLPKSKMYQYCLADIAKGLFNGMIGNYLLYFFQPTSKSGLPNLLPDNKLLGFITVMALITGISKVVDAISDPLVAGMSDKCESKHGRRMPFMRASAIPYAFSVVLIFYVPFRNGSTLNAIWVGFFLITYYIAYTFYFIPRNALIPEIIKDVKMRVNYYGVSTAFFMGSSSFMYAATLFVNMIKNRGISALWAWRIVFSFFGLIGITCLLLSAFAFDEKKYADSNVRPEEKLSESFKIVFKNRNFVYFTLGDLLSGISMAFFQTSMLYYITVLLNVKESQSFLVMLCAIGVALCLFPLVVKWSKKYGKKPMLMAANIIFTVVYCFIFVGDKISALVPGRELFIGLGMGVIVAFPFASINILPQSVVSDIIQSEAIKTKVNREGIFSSVKTFIEKIATAVAMMSVSSVLALGATGSEAVGIMGVKLTGVISAFFSVISLLFLSLYEEKEVLRSIERK
ncbi:MAG: MFS transporter [Spirochaetales bacterium]|nr:MFS transporter [Spirochaetales bacterium]